MSRSQAAHPGSPPALPLSLHCRGEDWWGGWPPNLLISWWWPPVYARFSFLCGCGMCGCLYKRHKNLWASPGKFSKAILDPSYWASLRKDLIQVRLSPLASCSSLLSCHSTHYVFNTISFLLPPSILLSFLYPSSHSFLLFFLTSQCSWTCIMCSSVSKTHLSQALKASIKQFHN